MKRVFVDLFHAAARSRRKLVLLILLVILCFFSLYYGSLVYRTDRADQAFLQGDYTHARQGYTDLLASFRDVPLIQRLFTGRYRHVLFNYVQLLHHSSDYADVVQTLEQEAAEMPAISASPLYHLWLGNAFFRIAVLQEGEELSFESLRTVADEYREALRLNPQQWDARYNLEFVTDLLRKRASQNPADKESLQLLLGDIRLTSEQRTGELPEKLQ